MKINVFIYFYLKFYYFVISFSSTLKPPGVFEPQFWVKLFHRKVQSLQESRDVKGALRSGHVRFKDWSLPFFKSPCHLCMEHSSEVGPWVAHPRLNLRHLWLGHCWNEKWRVGMHCSGCLFYWLAGHRCCWTDYRRIHSAKCVAAVFVTGTY